MNALQKEINEAYLTVSSMPVHGDQIEMVAAVRAHLRKAYQMAEETEPVTEEAKADG